LQGHIGTNAARLGAFPLDGGAAVIPCVLDACQDREPETVFRTCMAVAADMIWQLGYDDEALSALYDVIEAAMIQKEGGEDRRGDLPE
jgi:hypothetical protein